MRELTYLAELTHVAVLPPNAVSTTGLGLSAGMMWWVKKTMFRITLGRRVLLVITLSRCTLPEQFPARSASFARLE